jgi:peptidoglycan/LPS O-acetylase OafA/YrhL
MTKFRYDINALRALAVTAVVLFHYNVSFVPGGFTGVDIFFVISGYLMTEIISRRLADGKFSVWKFYSDRAKRIVPGLAGLCFGLLVIGWFVIDPVHYNTLSYTSVSALLFYSNYLFHGTEGYFDPHNDSKWLLHTWSLSVEWQFYILYPILVLILHRFDATRRHLAAILGALALASLALCIWYSRTDQVTAFYLLPQRAWEMAVGGIVALKFGNASPRRPGLMMAAGFLLIAGSLALISKNTPWPSYYALAPVLGTCLVIAANQSAAWPFRNPVVQTVGKWSYSIYLWHWPIAVGFIYFNFRQTTAQLILAELALLALVIGAGALILRGARWGGEKLAALAGSGRAVRAPAWAFAPVVAGFSVALGLALTVDVNRGFANRSAETSRQVATYRMVVSDWAFPESCNGADPAGALRPCRVGRPDGQKTLVIGDSFAMQVFNRLSETAKNDPSGAFLFLASVGCPPVTGIKIVGDTFQCNGFFDKALNFAAAENPRRIVLVSNWSAYFQRGNPKVCYVDGEACVVEHDADRHARRLEAAFASLHDRLLEFRRRGTEVALVSATPYGQIDVPSELLKRQFLGLGTADIAFIDRDQFEQNAALVKGNLVALAAATGATLYDPLDFLCDAHRCATLDPDGVPYFRDLGHYRAGAVRADRFAFFDGAAGLNKQYSAIAAP